MKILNLYCGVGGNRAKWGGEHEITAVEYNEEIAGIYKELYPGDNVIIGDAHEYLLNHYKEYEFIWSSPPCQTHSDIRRMGVIVGQNKPVFPDMNLWQEIIFLKHHCKTKYVIENVKPYYEPFVPPSLELDRHLFWSNFKISHRFFEKTNRIKSIEGNTIHFGVDLNNRKLNHSKRAILRNMVNPDLGKHILDCAMNIIQSENVSQTKLNL